MTTTLVALCSQQEPSVIKRIMLAVAAVGRRRIEELFEVVKNRGGRSRPVKRRIELYSSQTAR